MRGEYLPKRLDGRWALIPALVIAATSTGLTVRAQTEPAAALREGTDIRTDRSAEGVGAIIPIHSEITDITAGSVKRRIEEARQSGAHRVIFELNTPGGLVTSTFDIADQIRNLTDMRSVAWVNTTAHSGGALVAIACDEIVMARSSRIGDAQVIIGMPTGVQTVPEELKPKIMTPVLADVRASAQLRGYSQVLCEALVDPDLEVWWLENIETGRREFVFRDEKIKRVGESDQTGGAEDAGKPDKGSAEPGKTDTGADEGAVVDREKAAEADRLALRAAPTKWKLVESYHDVVLDREVPTIQPIVRGDQLLQMSASEAFAYGFSKGIVANDQELRQRYDLAGIVRLNPLWSETLALWMTSMWVRGFLMVIILLGAYVEFHTPGVGVPGLVALIALAVFVGAPYLAGLANVWEILFIVVGFLLITLEVFVIPGFGVAGILGLVLVLIGLLATFVPDEPGRSFPLYIPSLPSTIQGLKIALGTLVASMVASLLGMAVLSRFLPRMPVFGRIVPANPTPSEVAVEDPYHGLARVGDVGETVGPLRPAGKARFGSQLVDVVTQGEYLGTGVSLEVIERRGNRVVVRARKV